MSQENSAEWLRGAVAVLGRMVDDCSTVFDSDLPHITQSNLEDYIAEYGELLAAAEAREAGKVAAESAALARIHAIASRQLAEPAGAGDAVAMSKICTEVEAVGLQKSATPTEEASEAGKVEVSSVDQACDVMSAASARINQLIERVNELYEENKALRLELKDKPVNGGLASISTQPTAADVIAGAKKALGSWGDAMDAHGEWDDGCFYYAGTSASELQPRIESTVEIMKAIAAWEEAQR